MQRSRAPSSPSRIHWSSGAHRLARLALTLILAAPLILSVAACAGSQKGRAPEMQYPASASHAPRPSTPYVRDLRRTDPTAHDWVRIDRYPGTWSAIKESPSNWAQLNRSAIQLLSPSVMIVDEQGHQLYAKNARQVKPIASITKLMTAMVVLDTGVSMKTPIRIVENDLDRLKHSRSRLRIGEARLPRAQMMMVALMASDNRAAHALGRTTFRGGTEAFVRAMNRKARSLGMRNTRFVDPTGLDPRNRSTAEDLIQMVRAASRYSFIRNTTSRGEMTVYPFANGASLQYRNTNPLVRNPDWEVQVSKTGFINEAGRCLVMKTRIDNRSIYMVFLGSSGKYTPMGDSSRVRNWLRASHQTTAR